MCFGKHPWFSPLKQVVPSDTQENGQKESKRSEQEDEEERSEGRDRLSQEEKMEGSIQVSMETEPSPPWRDVDVKPGENYRRNRFKYLGEPIDRALIVIGR